MVMWYKKVQVILGLIKRENLIVLAVAKLESIAKIGPVSLPFIPCFLVYTHKGVSLV